MFRVCCFSIPQHGVFENGETQEFLGFRSLSGPKTYTEHERQQPHESSRLLAERKCQVLRVSTGDCLSMRWLRVWGLGQGFILADQAT